MTVAGSTASLLSEAEGRELLRIARETLDEFLNGGGRRRAGPSALSGAAAEKRGKLGEPRGVFVTLTIQKQLRGCTGYVEPAMPLVEAVRDLAVSSASRDHRFKPVVLAELETIHIEISVLTPPRPIAPEEVEVGRHGLIVRLAGRSGLLLPQVPVDWGWERLEFLARTCEKAGLPPDSWRREECRLMAFEAQIFGETA